MATTAKKAVFSSFHAQSFDPKRMELLLKHLVALREQRPKSRKMTLGYVNDAGKPVPSKINHALDQITAQDDDLEEATMTNGRLKWLIRVVEELNGPSEAYEGHVFQPRGTKGLITALRACIIK